MAQAANYEVGNGTGAAVRSAINSRFNALFTNHSGPSDTNIGTKYPYMFWAHDDPAVNQLKMRNSSNNGWIPLRSLADGGVEGGNTLAFRSNGVARMTIDSTIASEQGGPSVLFRTTVNPFLTNNGDNMGLQITQDGRLNIGMLQRSGINMNRIGNDGNYIRFTRDGNSTEVGNISVSSGTVSLVGAHLSRWSQLPGNAERVEILRGTVLSNLDEMCEWGVEFNDVLNRMKVSSDEGDVNVAGVFQSWDDDDQVYTKDFYCAMTGDFVIRVSQGVTVARGDLLMSAGDGTAKPQGDDIVRSKTIAKVTSTVVSETYADGSYCVPCVLMAC